MSKIPIAPEPGKGTITWNQSGTALTDFQVTYHQPYLEARGRDPIWENAAIGAASHIYPRIRNLVEETKRKSRKIKELESKIK